MCNKNEVNILRREVDEHISFVFLGHKRPHQKVMMKSQRSSGVARIIVKFVACKAVWEVG